MMRHIKDMAAKRKEHGLNMNEEITNTINALCKWIQKELKNASIGETESILPAVINATAELIKSNSW